MMPLFLFYVFNPIMYCFIECVKDIEGFRMFAAKVAIRLQAIGLTAGISLKHPVSVSIRSWKSNSVSRLQSFASESGSKASTLRRVKARSLKEIVMAPAGDGGLYCVLIDFYLYFIIFFIFL